VIQSQNLWGFVARMPGVVQTVGIREVRALRVNEPSRSRESGMRSRDLDCRPRREKC
jgi:hypothetical protein